MDSLRIPINKLISRTSKFKMILLSIGMLAALVVFLREATEPSLVMEPYQPLEGVLFSGPIEEMAKLENTARSLSQGTVAASDVKRLGFAQDVKELVLMVVPDSSAQFRLSPRDRWQNKVKALRVRVETSTGTTPSSGAVSPPAPEYSFKYFDAILEKSESSYVLDGRYVKGDVTFEIGTLCRWNDLYILKFSVTNEEEREFFISKVEVQADKATIASNSYAPFSCRSQRTIEGIVTFPIKGVKGRKVSLVLVEAGANGRTCPIKAVDYGF